MGKRGEIKCGDGRNIYMLQVNPKIAVSSQVFF